MIKTLEINKFDKEKKKNLANRSFIAVFVIIYYLIAIVLSLLSDSTDVSLNLLKLNINAAVKDILSFVYIFYIYIPFIFAVWEVNKLIFDNNKKTFACLLVSMTIFYLLPTILYIIFFELINVFQLNNWGKLFANNENKNTEINKIRIFICSFLFSIFVNIVTSIVLLKQTNKMSAKNVISLVFLTFMVPFGFMSFAHIGLYKSWLVLIYIFILVTCTDAFGYIWGSLFGKNKMAPIISPNKTWEGGILGTITSILISLVFASLLLFDSSNLAFRELSIFNSTTSWVNWIWIVCTSITIAIMSIIGDLTFSYIKRIFNIKDFSNTLASHGGILDRVDSMIFACASYITILLITSTMTDWALFS